MGGARSHRRLRRRLGVYSAMTQTKTQRWGLILTAMASFMVALDQLVVSTALDAIRLDLHASLEQLEWTVNAFTLAFAVLLMPASSLGDRIGRRRGFLAGLGVFVGASPAGALRPGGRVPVPPPGGPGARGGARLAACVPPVG